MVDISKAAITPLDARPCKPANESLVMSKCYVMSISLFLYLASCRYHGLKYLRGRISPNYLPPDRNASPLAVTFTRSIPHQNKMEEDQNPILCRSWIKQ